MGYIHYFLYKEVSEIVEELARKGESEFYPSHIRDITETEPKDYIPILENLENSGVLRRKFVRDIDLNGDYKEVIFRELGKHDPEDIYVKYEITDSFIEQLQKIEK